MIRYIENCIARPSEYEDKLCEFFNLAYYNSIEFQMVSTQERFLIRMDFCSVLRFIIENIRKNNETKEIIHLIETIFKND